MTPIEAAIAEQPASRTPLKMNPSRSGVLIKFPDPISYAVAWSVQQRFHAERLSGSRPDTLMLLEHLPIYTVGRRTRAVHLRPGHASLGHPVETVSRGGSVTYHGPGQLIAYPILELSQYAPGAKLYVHMLEEVVIRTLGYWEIHAFRIDKSPGVWTRDTQGESKIASIGVRIDRGITLHGVALNVSNDLLPFARIVPCGIDGCRMTSMEQTAQAPMSVHLVADHLAKVFSSVFQLEWSTVMVDNVIGTGAEVRSLIASTKEN